MYLPLGARTETDSWQNYGTILLPRPERPFQD
jgi:hypothetical protein